MGNITIGNINKSTTPRWGKIAAACLFISASLQTSGLSTEHHELVWAGTALTIIAGLIPIFTNGSTPVAPTP